jgi:lipopolysaccharide export system protein LptA
MKKYLFPMLGLGLVSVALAAQSNSYFRDHAGNMEVKNLSRWRVTQSREGVHFEGWGSPFIGIWKTQGLNLSAAKILADASGTPQKGLRLQSATVSGDVVATTLQQNGSTKLQTEVLKIYGGAQATRFEAPGALTITSTDSSRSRNFVSKASSGTVLVPVTGGNGFSTADLAGPVTFTATERVEGGTSNLNGRADKVTIDNTGAQPKIVMTGNVKITGDHPTIWADIDNASEATIILDKNFEIQEVIIGGDPVRLEARKGGG